MRLTDKCDQVITGKSLEKPFISRVTRVRINKKFKAIMGFVQDVGTVKMVNTGVWEVA